MNRRSLLGLLFAAPIAAPAAIKAAMAEQPMSGVAGSVVKLTLDSAGFVAGLGTITSGLLSNSDGSFVMDCARNVISFECDDITTDADIDNGYWDELHEIYELPSEEYSEWDDDEVIYA